MPNWVNNKLTILTKTAEQRSKVMSLLFSKDEEGNDQLDFNILLPMPEELNCTCGSFGDLGLEVINGETTEDSIRERYTDDQVEEILQLGRLYKSNIEKYGAPTWYQWHCKHWGCKWNADTSEIILSNPESIVIYYETPWSMPEGWLAELALVMPELYWENDADEEGGFFAGVLTHEANDPGLHWEDHENRFFEDEEEDFEYEDAEGDA